MLPRLARRRFSLATGPRSWWLGLVVMLVIASASRQILPSATAQPPDTAQPETPAAAPAQPPAGAQDVPAENQSEDTNLLSWAIRSLGWSYSIIFLSLSFTLVALIVMNTLAARRENVVPSLLVQEFEAHLNEKRYQEAYDLAKNDESFLGQVLSAGLAKLQVGYGQAVEAMQEVGEEENMKLDHRLSYMALIGTISPMIGLFGTVHGMINSFKIIATNTTSQPKAYELAAGISTALFTTLVGLAIAIPAIAAYNLLRNRVARLVLEVGIVSEGLMGRFQTVGAGAKRPMTPPA